MSKIRVLFVASECAPVAKVGGLGDVIGSLPKALAKLGVDVRVIIPLYEQIDRRKWKLREVKELRNYEIGNEKIRVYKMRLPRKDRFDASKRSLARNDRGVEVFLIYNKRYLSVGPIYFEKTAFAGSKKEIDRFAFFSRAVFQLLEMFGWRPDIVHCNDWHSGLLVEAIRNQKPKTKNQKPRTVFTIHNLANQGVWRDRNLMAEGIKNADIVTTVSPTYAKEILTKEYGAGLEELLRERRKDLVGILNGVDYDYWPVKGAPRQIQGKFWHKAPKFGLVSRLTYQKGIDLAVPLVAEFIKKHNAQFWFLGQGEARYEKALLGLAEKYPRNVFVKIGFDEKLARRIYRESDFFLMPSRFEPSGLGQMISMHYGTIPIVRATGGLKDTVKHLKTGFVFKEPTSKALRFAIEKALRYFRSPVKLAKMRKNCLAENFSWEKSASEYEKLYKRFL